MSNFYTDVIKRDPRFLSATRCNDVDLLFPPFRERVSAIINAAKEQGITLRICETYRSSPRQIMLFSQGATKLRTVGVHHYGLAADIVRWVGGEFSWHGDYSFLGQLARKEGLHWGGDWDDNPKTPNHFNDLDHVQYIPTSQQRALFAETWYP